MKQLKNIANILASKPDERGRKFLEYAQVKGGYIYATDTWIAIKFKVTNYMSEDEAQHLEGKLLHRSLLVEIGKAKDIKVVSSGFILDGVLFEFSEESITFPDIESVLGLGTKEAAFDVAAMDINKLTKLTKCFRKVGKNNEAYTFIFVKGATSVYPTSPIQVRNTVNQREFDEVGIIMPCIPFVQ